MLLLRKKVDKRGFELGIDLLNFIKAIVIGIVEGITEWLPISSTGHMLLINDLWPLEMDPKFEEMFFVVIQLGAIIAVIVMFWDKIFPIRRIQKKTCVDKKICHLWLKIIVATLPAAILGLLFDDLLEEYFGTPLTIAIMLIVYGVAFIIVELWNKKRVPKVTDVNKIPYSIALAIGFFQALSMIPGTSRSGATIVGALILGVSRTSAAEFTFYLAIPTMIGASLYKLYKFGLQFTSGELIVLISGSIVAFAVSLFVIKFLMSYIKRHDFRIFGWYRIVLGLVVIAISVFNLV